MILYTSQFLYKSVLIISFLQSFRDPGTLTKKPHHGSGTFTLSMYVYVCMYMCVYVCIHYV